MKKHISSETSLAIRPPTLPARRPRRLGSFRHLFLPFRYLSLWLSVHGGVVILTDKHVMQATRRRTFPWEVFGDLGPFMAQESYQSIPNQ